MKTQRKKWLAFLLAIAMVITQMSGIGLTGILASAATSSYEEVEIVNPDGTKGTVAFYCTAASLQAIDIDTTNLAGGNFIAYAKVTKASSYSYVRISGGSNSGGGFSNRALYGTSLGTKDSSANYYIHNGYGTGKEGTGIGAAGTGIYTFPSTGLTKAKDSNDAAIKMTVMTSDLEIKLLGFAITDSAKKVHYVGVNEDGSLAKDFDPSKLTLEAIGKDNTDIDPEEAAAAAEKERQAARTGLKAAIDGCKVLAESYYTADSWATLQNAIPTAEAVYADEKKTKDEYKAARDALESVRINMLPKASTDAGNPKDFRVLSKAEVINEMGAGINLGNTLDGHTALTPSETSWQAFKTTKEYIKALHDAGYNTVRVPVTWGTMINEDYSINEAWMNRVQEIVDYCTDQDMYCIINVHHDGAANHDNRGNNTPMCWLDTAANDIEAVYAKFEGVWKSIAERFKDYDEHLIFEDMNEVTDAHDGTANEDTEVLNNLNQLFVNTVRATGSNNTKRWLAFTGRFATYSVGTTLPSDKLSTEESMRLMFSVHIYKDNSNVRWTYDQLKTWQGSLSSTVKNVQGLSPDIPIYVGEYGVRQKKQSGSDTGYNNVERALNSEFCAATAAFYGACPIVWDQGLNDYSSIKTDEGNFVYWDRPNAKPVYEDVVEGMIRGSYLTYSSDLGTRLSDIYTSYGHASTNDNGVSKDVEVKQITGIDVSDSVTLKAGERTTLTATVAPEDTNDVLLWSTEDDSVATVSKGLIHAKRAGITTIHAYSQSKSVTKDIKVIVGPSGKETATGISTDKAYYTVKKGENVTINTKLTPASSKDEVTYTSSNTEIVTVNSSGVVTAVGVGSAYVIVTAASGISTIVNIKVPKEESVLNVSLHAYYNNGEEEGSPVAITGDGQYTVTLDYSKDLSEAGKTAGIADLNKVVSIYIKDCNAKNPIVEEAQIRYDKVTVNDTDLTITNTDFKSAIKANGQFDTNDPINGWDGSAVKEVTTDTSDHTVSFTGIENPTKISVTFTIQGLKFVPVKEKENEATAMTTTDKNKILLKEVGDTADLTLSLTPVNTDSLVTFYSTDASVVAVNNTAQAVDENGKVKMTVTGVGKGTATVVAITENGLKVLYAIGVGDVTLKDPVDPTPPGLDGSDPTTPPTDDGKPGGTVNSPAPTLKLAKSAVIVAAGKSVTVKATTNQKSIKATAKSSKVAKVKVTGKKIKISVPKKAVKGASTVVTVKAGSKTAKIKVTVKNPAKKIKAAKKTVKVKKGKKAKITFKVTAANKKKAAVDTIKVTSKNKKVAKVMKYSVKKGKAIVTVKGVKKGKKTTVTLKIGKKKAKVTIRVK